MNNTKINNKENMTVEITFNISVEKNGKEENISFRNQFYPD